MMIDWVTVAAQLFNFAVLVWLLKRFLYKPILRAIDEREARIAAEMATADNRQTEAQAEIDEFSKKNQDFEQQRDALLRQMATEVETEKSRLLEEVRQSSEMLRAKMQETLKNEQYFLQQEIRRRTQWEVFAITRKTLTELAGLNLEQLMVESFVQRLRKLPEEEKKLLASAFVTSSMPGIIRSAFELPTAERAAIKTVFIELFGEVQVDFETSPDLIAGIELSLDGHKVAWSIDHYLLSMEQSLNEVFQAQRQPQIAVVKDPAVKSSKGAPDYGK